MRRWILFGTVGVAAVAAGLWSFARHETPSLAIPALPDSASASDRGAAAFEGSAFGGLSMSALETHALPWRLVAAALVLQAQSQDPTLPANQETLDGVLSGFGFLPGAVPANRPAAAGTQAGAMPLGFTYGDLAPVGGTTVRVINLGCPACHAGVTYTADGQPDPQRAWLGMPNTSLDLEAYTVGVLQALKLGMAEPDQLLETADALFPDMGWRERQTLRWLVLPLVRQKLAALGDADRPLPFPNGVPGATNGVAALKHALGVPLAGGGPGDAGFVSVPDLGDRHRRSSLLVDGAYAVPGQERQRPTGAADLDADHLQALATIATFFTVPSMGVHLETAETYLDEAFDIFTFLKDDYRPQPFPGPVDDALALDGEAVFARECAECHGTYGRDGGGLRLDSFPNWRGDVSTDPLRASVFSDALVERIGDSLYGSKIAVARTDDYVAPPLTGLWASAPYLHNGSVPTVEDLLMPERRPQRFQVGGHALDFDRLGLRLASDGAYPGGYTPFSNPVWYDTSLPGQSNAGHDFGESLGETEKRQLIEFLKLL